jgi:hypothetical protein
MTRFLKDWNVFTRMSCARARASTAIKAALVLYVIEGKGYTICDGQRLDWERGDLILLPIQPGGVEHQHFNLNGDKPSFWMAYIYKPFHDEVAHGMEQRERGAGVQEDEIRGVSWIRFTFYRCSLRSSHLVARNVVDAASAPGKS